MVEAGPENGPVVLLLHGFPEFWWGWRHQIGPLARAGFRVVVPDQRGYGCSDKPAGIDAYRLPRLGDDVAALIEALGGWPVRLAGHDWGGIVAWWVAARRPDLVERLAILNAPHPDTAWRVLRADPKQIGRSWYVGLFQLPWIAERLLRADDHAWLRRALVGSGRRRTFSPADLERYAEAWSRPGALTAMLGWYRALVRRPPRKAGRIPVPALVLWGRRDSALGPTFATESLALCDDGRLRWFDDATHWVQHEKAVEVSDALVGHFRPA